MNWMRFLFTWFQRADLEDALDQQERSIEIPPGIEFWEDGHEG